MYATKPIDVVQKDISTTICATFKQLENENLTPVSKDKALYTISVLLDLYVTVSLNT